MRTQLLQLLILALDCASGFRVLATSPARHSALATRRLAGVSCREIPIIEDTDSYHALIASSKAENKIVVIKFYASWCRACKAMSPKFVRVAEDWPHIEFHEILFDNNKKLCKSLGIKVLPYMEIYAGSTGKVDGFTCGPSKVSLLVSKLEDTSALYCDVESIECTNVAHLLPED
jgi:thiol-disulfide isomerase/thioredoxin